ncbi:MAG: nitrate- and nitrite sensing domain-containing protein [Pseudomonadota bacterium]
MKIGRSSALGSEIQRFESGTFESALRLAADAGVLKSVCLEKQIAFLAKTLPARASGAGDDDVSPGATRELTGERLFPSLTAAISALVHEIQVERGTSSVYLSSQGRLFASEMRGQWGATDERRTQLTTLLRSHAGGLPGPFVAHLEHAERLLAELGALRAEVEALNASAAGAIERYSNVTRDLLFVIDSLAMNGFYARSRPTALAWMALLHAKEKTGQERAQLATAFTQDRYADGQHAVVSALIASCDSYLHVFSAAAPRLAGDLLRQKLQTDVATAVTDMERVALRRREGGFGIDPRAWFSTMSRKMDFLGDVESSIRASLTPGM